ncbi:pseudouridine synthase [Solidesulfovibrio carbinolicus]|uniref:Pseudouridine synthase n=1 Tax=Solidesulfovibrio carbinolicus TaxID=296842 RepID=A0A4P6HKS6_9BACT|nr:pseudouridine synthase [Solidesulfovibrio carbinolicus]QAZ67767.1 rRNA pseudouridine synthase [Solidesulfovibrio carbinolicus]
MDTTDSRLTRINKALASAGVCSRRHADDLIAAGRVTVNGAVVTEAGLRIDPARDALAVDGAPVNLAVEMPVTLALHKKPGVVTTASDPEGRPTVFDGLPEPWRGKRLFPVGRLDYFSEGLLLLTTDGELALRLTHPRWHVPKRYRVTVRGRVTPDMLGIMARGMRLAEGERLAPVAARLVEGPAQDRSILEMELHQGVNRQIRRMCRDLGLTVLRLARVSQGPVALGDLSPGACRELAPTELAALRQSVALDAPDVASPPPPPWQAAGGDTTRPPRPARPPQASGKRPETKASGGKTGTGPRRDGQPAPRRDRPARRRGQSS